MRRSSRIRHARLDGVGAGRRDDLSLHDLVGVVERAPLGVAAQHLPVGADGLRRRNAEDRRRFVLVDGPYGGAAVNAGDFLEAFEGALVDRTTQTIYRKHAVLLVLQSGAVMAMLVSLGSTRCAGRPPRPVAQRAGPAGRRRAGR